MLDSLALSLRRTLYHFEGMRLWVEESALKKMSLRKRDGLSWKCLPYHVTQIYTVRSPVHVRSVISDAAAQRSLSLFSDSPGADRGRKCAGDSAPLVVAI